MTRSMWIALSLGCAIMLGLIALDCINPPTPDSGGWF